MTDKEKKSKIADILMDFQEEYSNEVINRPMLASLYAGNILSFIDSLQEEPISEELEEACEQLAENARKHKAETSSPFFSQTDYKQGVIDGAKWQKKQDQKTIELAEDHAYFAGMEKMKEQIMKNIWKLTDGDDLPDIDREVVALLDNGKVVFAHRPPECWDGKDIMTGKVTRYYPKRYDGGGWNIPNVKWWLDAKLPKEIEL